MLCGIPSFLSAIYIFPGTGESVLVRHVHTIDGIYVQPLHHQCKTHGIDGIIIGCKLAVFAFFLRI